MKRREDAVLAALRDLVMGGQESVESRDLARLEGLLGKLRHLNLKGRFLDRSAGLARLRALDARIDKPSLQIVRVEELTIEEETALATYLVDLTWIDLEGWKEVYTTLLLTLELEAQGGGWTWTGLTLTELPSDRAGTSRPQDVDEIDDIAGLGDAGEEFYSFMRYPKA